MGTSAESGDDDDDDDDYLSIFHPSLGPRLGGLKLRNMSLKSLLAVRNKGTAPGQVKQQ